MISNINTSLTYQDTIHIEQNEPFEDFMDRLHNILEKFERITYSDTENNLYRKVLKKRMDVYKEKRIKEFVDNSIIQYIIRDRIKVILQYQYQQIHQ